MLHYRSSLLKFLGNCLLRSLITVVIAVPCIHSAKVFTVTNTNALGVGSFAAAVDSVNLAGTFGVADTVKFAILGNGPHTIAATTCFNEYVFRITKQAVIDGFTQTGSSPNTLPSGNNMVLAIRLIGYQTACNNMFLLQGDGITLKGLYLDGGDTNTFSNSKVVHVVGRDCSIQGCQLVGNGTGTKILVEGKKFQMGGSSPDSRMVVQAGGVAVGGNVYILADSCTIRSSFICTDAVGLNNDPLDSPFPAIGIALRHATIGGATTRKECFSESKFGCS